MDNEKKYNELIGKIKRAYLYAQTGSTKAVLEDILPELKEGKDEKIRKAIYGWINTRPSLFFDDGFSKEEMLAWLEKQDKSKKYIFKSIPRLLDMIEPTERAKAYTKKLINTLTEEGYITDAKIVEECLKQMNGEHVAMAVMNEKQGEQKPADKTKPKFHEGQWIVWQDKCYKVNYNGCGYELVDQNGLSTSLEYGTVDENAHIWDITKDARVGDVLVDEDINVIGIFEGTEGMCWHSKIYYSYATKELYGIECGGSHQKEFAKPATKEQRNQLEKAMVNTGYTFDFEKKEPKKIEQKTAWSEDDEEKFRDVIRLIEQGAPVQSQRDHYTNWLKSLKDRYAWKPSDEQKVM